MYRPLLFFTALFFLFFGAQGQTLKFKLKRSMSFYLPDETKETSGLVHLNGELFTHNDSGGKPEIYVLDTLGGPVKRTIFIRGAENKDWEALTFYNQTFYIGDFGNNSGKRRNLGIYRVPYKKGADTLDVSDRIEFFFPEQEDFSDKGKNHHFDTEAMVVHRDSIFLYSKSWDDNICRVRVVPDVQGKHPAPVIRTFPGSGLITDAHFDEQGKRIIFTGYNLNTGILRPFIWIFPAEHPAKFDADAGMKLDISPDFVQMEGITLLPSGRLAVTSEAIAEKWLDIPPVLYLFFPPKFPE